MKPIIRYRSQLLYRRAYRPDRPVRGRFCRMRIVARPSRSYCRHRDRPQNLAFIVSF